MPEFVVNPNDSRKKMQQIKEMIFGPKIGFFKINPLQDVTQTSGHYCYYNNNNYYCCYYYSLFIMLFKPSNIPLPRSNSSGSENKQKGRENTCSNLLVKQLNQFYEQGYYRKALLL